MNSRKMMVAGFAVLTLPCFAWGGLLQQDGNERSGGLNSVNDIERYEPVSSAAASDRRSVAVMPALSRQAEILVAQVTPATSMADVTPADFTDARPEFIVPTHVVNTPGLRVRFSPDTSDRIAGILYRGDDVQLLEETGQWSHVAYDSKGVVRTGWALSRLIVEQSAAGETPPGYRNQTVARPAPSAEPEHATTNRPLVTRVPLGQESRPELIAATHFVDTDALRVRFTPDTDSTIAVVLYSGDDVQLLESAGSWSKVAYESKGVVRTGWALSRLLADRSAAGRARPRNPDVNPGMAQSNDQAISRPEPVAPPVVHESKPEIPPLVSAEPLPPETTVTQAAQAMAAKRIMPTHIVGANALRLRLTPEASAEIAVILNSGEEVQLLESAGEWTQVAYASDGVVHTGWVASGLIVERSAKDKTPSVDPAVSSAERPASAAAGPGIATTHIVISEALRVRFTPNTRDAIAAMLYAGDEVRLLESADGWSNVAYDADGVVRTGWVMSRLIVERQPALPDPSAQSTPEAPESPDSSGPGRGSDAVATIRPPSGVPMISSSRLVTTHVVKTNMAQVRLQPYADAGIRDVLIRGHEMRKLQTSGAWTRIAYHSDGVTRSGWLLSSLIMEL